MSSNTIYYTYAYIRSKDSKIAKAGTPYYIGKGKDNRAYVKHKGAPTPTDKKYIVFLETNLSELGALALERRYIKWFGRVNNKSGILRNLTDGGEGCYGLTHNDETKNLLRELTLRQIFTKERNAKISESLRGKPGRMLGKSHNNETKIKMRHAKIGRKQNVIVCPYCGKIGGNTMLRYHFDNCKSKTV